MVNVVDDLNSRFRFGHISIIAATSLPEIGCDKAFVFCTARWALLDRLQDLRHIVDFIHRANEQMDVVGHEDVGKNHEVVSGCCFVDSFGQQPADFVILKIWLTMESGKG